jgi:predicted MFS family arabinose efflux permease
VLNAIFRVAYPLVPFIAFRFSIPIEQATWIVTIQVLMGLASPGGGWLGDRIGYRATMICGLGMMLIGTLGIAFGRALWMLIAAYGACGLGVALYQPAVQAYIGAFTSYQERGRAVGLIEMSWALAGMAAVPPLTWMIHDQQSLAGPFAVLSMLVGASMLATWFGLPADDTHLRAAGTADASFRAIVRNPSVLGLAAFLFLAMGGWETLFIVQAPWVTERFNATLTDLGTAAFIFGAGELVGSLGSALITDRLGKRRAATLGFTIIALLYLVQPLASVNWPSYLLCYLLFAVFVEFSIVASLTLGTTISTVGRATVMALVITAVQAGRAIGSQIGVPVLNTSSLFVNCLIAATLTLAGVAIVLRYVQESERHSGTA